MYAWNLAVTTSGQILSEEFTSQEKMVGKEVYGMTFSLLTTSEGKKMGKTQKGALWLDPNRTSPFDFFQYWRNVSDADVEKCLRMLTFYLWMRLRDLLL